MSRRTRTRPTSHSRGGFTLIETALATIIVGVGVLAMVDAQQAFLRSNTWSSHAAGGALLGTEIRELTRRLPKHDPVVGLTLAPTGGAGMILNGWGVNANETTIDDFDDIDDFDGLILAFDGTPGLADGDLPGPVNAFRDIVPELNDDGTEMMAAGVPVPAVGWTQQVIVEKVHPFDTSLVMADDAVLPPAAGFKGLGVDEFPLRVTVVVWYQPPSALDPDEVARTVWIVP